MKEKNQIESKFLDSSIWLEYLINEKFGDIIKSEKIIYVSQLSLFEIKRVLLRRKYPLSEVNLALEFVKKRSIIINLSNQIVDLASEISIKNKLSALDALIYTTSLLNNSIFLTLDNDFRNLQDSLILKTK